MTLLVVSRSHHLGLLAARHPARTNLWIQVDVHFVLKVHCFIVRKLRQQLAQALHFLGVIGIGWTHDWSRATPNKPRSMQGSPHGFRAQVNIVFPRQYFSEHFAGPTLPEVTK